MSQQITITIDDATRIALINRTGAHCLSAETVALAMLHQFSHHAPPEIVNWLAGARGNPGNGNMWTEFGMSERTKQRADFAPELALAAAVRVVVATKR